MGGMGVSPVLLAERYARVSEYRDPWHWNSSAVLPGNLNFLMSVQREDSRKARAGRRCHCYFPSLISSTRGLRMTSYFSVMRRFAAW